ncbi:hypothetical protein NLX85_17125 [Micromonospora sp. A3M-1-15]|uniref:hypothetical protein n=1 Tax=Micromonospora sp. A3M-1-15 TaxID=2962035 RepID=UPI0020B6EE5D|nr:hypothetical protein [Micromonospora sp. A3M-1-15]MCP3785093.1 hypothetical protein [Micromonospora sp. A3M-1-15]
MPVNDTGLPPESIGQDWLWVEYGGELLAADVDGVYEPVAGRRFRADMGVHLGARGALTAAGDQVGEFLFRDPDLPCR